MAQALDMTDGDADALVRAAAMHDIGKAAIFSRLPDQDRPQAESESLIVRGHTLIGERILGHDPVAARLVRSSQERWDGGGYPDRLSGTRIPLGSRIILVCDAYDAMTSPRSDRDRLTREDALAELRANAGTQFDPDMVAVFCTLGEGRSLDGERGLEIRRVSPEAAARRPDSVARSG